MFFSDWTPLAGKKIGLLVVLVGVFCFCSCEIFEVRDAEEPTGGGGEFQIQRTPQAVISNLRNSLFSSDPINYEEVLSKDFIFVPDAGDVAEFDIYYPGILTQWGKDVEAEVVTVLLSRLINQPIDLGFEEESKEVLEETDSTYIFKASYSIVVCLIDRRWEKYYGICIVSINLESDGLWRMTRWEDYRRSEPPEDSRGTWGILKGNTRATGRVAK
ncbi:MAG: hypothetical protein ACUVQ7_06595 [bacterium]